MSLPEFSVNRRVTITMLVMIVVLGGVIAYSRLGLDMMPEMDYPNISVITTYEGVAPEDMEQLVTKPLEEAVSTVKHVKHVYSTSDEGLSSIMVELEWGTDLDAATQDMRDMIDQVKEFLPDDASNPMVLKFDPSQMPVLFYGVTGMENTRRLRDYLDDNVKPKLERIDGVGAVMLLGGEEREINIFVDKTKLEAHKLSLEQLIGTLRAENLNFSCGQATKDYKEYLVRVLGEYKNLKSIENTPVSYQQGVPVYVKDVARVEDTHKEMRFRMRLNKQKTVMLGLTKQSGANTVTVVNKVKKAMEEMKEKMPGELKFHEVMDQSHIIKKIISSTIQTVFIGGILAVIFIFLFLRNWRPTLAISLAIPISIIATFIGLYVFGYTLNMLTLMGLALAVGMLLDNAVVVIENTFRHLELGKTRIEAAKAGANEVAMAVATSTLTTIAVFLPMILGGGMASEMSRPLASTVVISLVASLFVALTLVPMVASVLFKQRKKEEWAEATGESKFEKIKGWYKKSLAKALHHRGRVVLIAGGAFLLSLVVIYSLGFEFMPKMDIPMLIFNAKLPVGTNLDETDRVLSSVEDEFLKIKESKLVASMIGPSAYGQDAAARASGMGAADVNEGMIMTRLFDLKDRKRSSSEIIEELRKKIPKLNDTTFEFTDMSGMMMGGVGQAPVEIKIFGKELDKLKEYADEIADKIKDVDGLRDITVSMREGKTELQVKVDREKAYHYGLTVAQIGSNIQVANLGRIATRYRTGGDEHDIMVRFRKDDRKTVSDIRNLSITSPLGFSVGIPDVANLIYNKGPITILREDRMRKVTVTADTTGRPIGKITADINQKLKDLKLPSGYFIEYGGSYKQMKETFTTLLLGFFAAVILIYMIMAAQFESFTQPLVIMFTVPLAIIGVALGLALFGMPLSTSGFMGIIILAGVVVNNGIVMIDYVNQLRKKGIEKHQALIEAAATRLRPIFITAFSTILGVLPMAFAHSEGWEMRAPMGITVASGLFVATFLTLFVVPTLYSIADHISYKTTKKMKKRVHGEEEDEL